MSKLIAMRQRIKAVETIKKVTHAMRLISMSTHTRLKNYNAYLTEYRQTLTHLINKIFSSNVIWHNDILWPASEQAAPLVILIGSQKGLCGTFNTSLFNFFEYELAKMNRQALHTIAVGKKAVEYIEGRKFGTIVMEFPELVPKKIGAIASSIGDYLWHCSKPYSSVMVYYNLPKSFFAQIPSAYQLIPLFNTIEKTDIHLKESYYWQQNSAAVLDALGHRYLQSVIQDLLYQSLIAEQAARFIAMDSSTKNAKNLLESMQMDYNKLRQAKITRELTDLAGSF